MLVNKIYHKINRICDDDLSIVIPTFNRVENLKKLLQNLNLNIINCKVLILDNYSENYLDDSFYSKLINIAEVTVYRNSYFISAFSNFLRAIELSNTNWVLPLGDSKILFNNAVNTVLRDIQVSKDLIGIVYSYESRLKIDSTVSSISSLKYLDFKFGDILLAGNSVYRRSHLIKCLPIADKYHYTHAPMPLFMFCGLSERQKIRISKESIISFFLDKHQSFNPPKQYIECIAGFPRLAKLAENRIDSKILIKFIIRNDNYINKFNFLKYCVIKISRDRLDISDDLKDILKYRYIHSFINYEKLIIYILILLSNIYNIKRKIK